MAGPLKSGLTKPKVSLATKHFAIVVARWNEEITEALYEAAIASLIENGVPRKNIIRKNVPGSFELSLGGLLMAEKKNINAVICLGCVIQGETPHFDYICQAVAYGITQASLMTRKPVVFGVLTTRTKQQALDRAGGRFGNKGEEAALTALEMLGWGKG
ncbi:MAG TPA: 6,7-dimethyl-8-ribityllumazine synthase [Cyclobacteriaceae bacterium]|jgi:6,7-dimethyl-8-ribityllumazine synthase